MGVDSIKIYRSYYEAINKLSNESEKCKMLLAIMEYGFNAKEPSFSGTSEIVWLLIKPNLDSSITSYKLGKNGGLKSGKSRGVPKGGSEGGFRTNNDKDKDNKKDKDIRKTSFEKSKWFDKNVFATECPKEWDKETKAHWYNKALTYSSANGGKYIDWMAAVTNWHREHPFVSNQHSSAQKPIKTLTSKDEK